MSKIRLELPDFKGTRNETCKMGDWARIDEVEIITHSMQHGIGYGLRNMEHKIFSQDNILVAWNHQISKHKIS